MAHHRLRGMAARNFEESVSRHASPYNFFELARESPRANSQTCRRFQELLVRFSHQLQRLNIEHQAVSSPSSPEYSRAGERALRVLLALHVDSVQRLSDFIPVIERIRDGVITPSTSRWRVDDDEILSTMLEELEARHGAASETVMEAIQAGSIRQGAVAPYLSTRISTQLLLQHHLKLWGRGSKESAPGSVVKGLPLGAVVSSATSEGKILCDAHYSSVPDVSVIEVPGSGAPLLDCAQSEVTVATAPALARYVILEILKNALRASVEAEPSSPPTVKVWVQDEETLTKERDCGIRCARVVVVDRGPGIDSFASKNALDKLGTTPWSYFGTESGRSEARGVESLTDRDSGRPGSELSQDEHQLLVGGEEKSSPKLWDRLEDQVSYMPARSPLHGIGVGLALSNLHAVYLGGSLELVSPLGLLSPPIGAAAAGHEATSGHLANQAGTAAIFRVPVSDRDDGFLAREGIPLRVQ